MLAFLSPPPTPFEPPPLIHHILSSPLKFLAQQIYSLTLLLRGPAFTPPSSNRIRLVCISDTHTHKPTSIPPGDVLIHSGDLANAGTVAEIQNQINWLASLPHKHKIVVAGNHDSFFDPRSRRKEDMGKELDLSGTHYLQHSKITLAFPDHGARELVIYGAPQIPRCGGKDFAFQYQRGEDAWSGTIPPKADILVTHTPPKHHLDLPIGMGCEHLLKEVWRVRPRVHVFGHVHAGYGREYVFWDESQKVFERLCARGERGVLRDAFAVTAWIDMVRLIVYGVLGVLWSKVWGGDEKGGIMINAALTFRSTGRLGNAPQIVDV